MDVKKTMEEILDQIEKYEISQAAFAQGMNIYIYHSMSLFCFQPCNMQRPAALNLTRSVPLV